MADIAIYAWDQNEDSIPWGLVDETADPPEMTLEQSELKLFSDTDPSIPSIISDLQNHYGTTWAVYSGNPSTPPPRPPIIQ